MLTEKKKTYIGDGLYASFDGDMICITAENGMQVLNEIFLEPQVLESLLKYIEIIYNLEPIVLKKLEETE